MEQLIRQLGGELTAHTNVTSTWCVVADTPSQVQLRAVLKSMPTIDIVRPEWIHRCAAERRLCPLAPADVWRASTVTQTRFDQHYDRYGDSYVDAVDGAELRALLERVMDIEDADKLVCAHVHTRTGHAQELDDTVDALMTDADTAYKYGLLHRWHVYVDRYARVGDVSSAIAAHPLDIVEERARLIGARVHTDAPDEHTSHVLVHSDDRARVDIFNELNRQRTSKFRIIDEHDIPAMDDN
jgi:hypothetical protein